MMKKIESQETKEQSLRRKRKIMSLFLLFLMVFSTLGYAFLSGTGFLGSGDGGEIPVENDTLPPEPLETDLVQFSYGGSLFQLTSTYSEVKKVPVDISLRPSTYAGATLYIDANASDVSQELASHLGKVASRVQRACYGSCTENIPEKNCTDLLIVWRASSEENVYQEENCVFIQGKLVAADAFLYRLFTETG